MIKIAVIATACAMALAPIPSFAADVVPHVAPATAARTPHHPASPRIAGKAEPRLLREALWPIYFYGCDDDDPDCA